jgi:Tol biopolymer transport system component/imidazolonepropionase-like amidohydrolase
MPRLRTPLALALTVFGLAAEEAKKPWSVAEAHGPVKTQAFEVREGTWLSLDLHPDGKRLVFSLLGDLYLLDAAGGAARRITFGAAMDLQPRFSPDGKTIAFASDRSGCENLWTCDLEGQQLRQVTFEKEQVISGPAWSPDGSYLVARKRFTDVSSIGVTELWLYHLQGGKGVQLTKKEAVADVADPAFSKDGRFIYFSARPGRYRYNADVNGGIWQIQRLDRQTGQTLPVTAEYGGAGSPALSPDGARLAYVRRIRERTRLEVVDLASGQRQTIAEGLDRDEQEGFAYHGVFPGFAWTPDGSALVAQAEGKFWRFPLQGARTAIPFTAQVEQQVHDALRTAPQIDTDTVRARLLRWPVATPEGKWLVFAAAGQLYVQGPEGPDLAYSPSFSPDGARLVWVSWSDALGGQIWSAPFKDGKLGAAKRLSTVSGQYANPSFSTDGKKLVFLKGSGSISRTADLDAELWHEVHWMDAEGGPSRFIAGTPNRGNNRRMARPQFNPEGTRVLFLEDEPPAKPGEAAKSLLVSWQLDGKDRRVHLKWPRAEEAVVSPDGKWVAYSELHNAYLTALPPVGGQTVEVADDGALPVAKLSSDGGEWLAWADQGKALTWIYGPRFSRLELAKAFPEKPAAEGAKDKAETKLPVTSRDIVLELPRSRPTGLVAYTGARLVTLKGDEVIEGGTILVNGHRIQAVGAAGQVAIPAGTKVVDLKGKTLIPGFFDEHAHLHYSTLDILPQQPWKYLANLAYGVTATHDPSASTHEVFTQGEMVAAGLMKGPRIFSTGFILYGAENAGRAITKSLDDARAHVKRLKSLGAFSVKSYMQPAREQRQWLIQAAREEGLMVVPEGGGSLEYNVSMILDGHTTIEHALPVSPLRQDVVTLFGKSGTAYTPTLLVAYGGLSGENWFHQHFDIWKDERLALYVPQSILDRVGRRRTMAPDSDWHHLDVAASAKKVMEAGGRVNLGGHGQMQGLGPHWEVWAFVQGGMSPLQALRTATLYPAETLGLAKDLGSLEPGKLADFMILDRNPLEDIHATTAIASVVQNGVLLDPKNLRPARLEGLSAGTGHLDND